MIPTALKIARGTDQPCRLKENEPKFDPIVSPVNLDLLDEDGLREWKRIFPLMSERGLATEVDEHGLLEWCYVISKLRFLHSRINNENMIIEKNQQAGKNFAINPYIKLYDLYFEKMLKLSGKFGFTPADRTRINMPKAFSKKEKLSLIRRNSVNET